MSVWTRIQAAGFAAALWLAGGAVAAQDYPAKPINLVMPYAAGGPGDTIARLLAQGLAGPLKQQVVVENAPGAGGSIGSAKFAVAAPDGYNLLLIHISHAANPALYPKLRHDPIKDYEPVGLVVDLPSAFVAKKAFPANSLAEMIAYVKANAEKVTYAHAGVGSASHLCGLLFAAALDVKLTQVAYRGSGPAMNDMLGGQVDLLCDQTVNVVSNLQAGSIKGYAVTGTETVPALADLPLASQSGLPGFTYNVWYGLFAPKGTPKPIIDKLVSALNDALKDPAIRSRLEGLGAQPVSPERAQPAALAAHLKAEIDKWTPIIKAAGVTGAQ